MKRLAALIAKPWRGSHRAPHVREGGRRCHGTTRRAHRRTDERGRVRAGQEKAPAAFRAHEIAGALDWTVVAHLLDVEGAVRELSALGARRPMLTDREILYVAARPETPTEHAVLRARNLPVIALEEVHRDPRLAGRRAASWGARFVRLLVRVDVDALSYTAFPIAENVRREDGLSLSELGAILAPLVAAPNWAALTITEVNPDHAPVEAETFGAFLGMLEQAFAGGAATAASP